MTDRFARGSVARLYLDLVTAGAGVPAQAPTIAIQRRADGLFFNVSSGLFQSGFVTNPMTELDATNLPGRYYFDFDHSKDLLVSERFIVKKVNAGSPAATQYDDIAFGPMSSTASALTCAIQGTVLGPDGDPIPNTIVEATLIPVLVDGIGRGFGSDMLVRTYTAADGSFSLDVVRNATIRLQIPAIGYDRKATVPSLSSVLFTNL